MKVLKKIVETSISILAAEGIKDIPEVSYTKAKTYYGELDFQYMKLRISRLNLDKGEDWTLMDIYAVIDTVAHEVAHLKYIEHGKEHDKLTQKYNDLILSKWR